jgi:anti-sigma regulatory factor (Ser/Thr protein kinase)
MQMFERREFPTAPSSLSRIRRYIEDSGAQLGVPDHVTMDLLIAVSEAAANAITHSDSRMLFVSLEREDHCVQVQIEDEGIFRPHMPLPELSLGESGRGMLLMTALTDELFVRRGSPAQRGTIIRLVKCWG